MIFTSYYGAIKKGNLPEDKCVSISLYNPTKLPQCLALAPKKELLDWWKSLSKEQQNAFENIELYCEKYNSQLNELDAEEVYKLLNGKILCCFEKSEDFCHRHLVAGWLKYEVGADVKEITTIKEYNRYTNYDQQFTTEYEHYKEVK